MARHLYTHLHWSTDVGSCPWVRWLSVAEAVSERLQMETVSDSTLSIWGTKPCLERVTMLCVSLSVTVKLYLG